MSSRDHRYSEGGSPRRSGGGGSSPGAYSNDVASPISYHHTSMASSEFYEGRRPATSSSKPVISNSSHRQHHQQHSSTKQHDELSAIQDEISRLKAKRGELEEKRQRLRMGFDAISSRGSERTGPASTVHESHRDSGVAPYRPSSARAPSSKRSKSTGGGSRNHHHDESVNNIEHRQLEVYERQQSSRSRAMSVGSKTMLVPTARPLDHEVYLPSERERRMLLSTVHDPSRSMKSAIRRSMQVDSTLVGGYFNLEDNPKVGTFGRERRFINPQGNSHYYLSSDVEKMQRAARSGSRPHYSVANRGKSGCNVNSHWNDSKGGGAPGPGAYTPRYQKLAPPSILTRL